MKNVTKAAIAVAVMLAAGVLWVGYRVLHGDADIPPVPDPALDTQDISISVGEAKIDARLYQKRGVTPSAGLLWMHGGAFAGGSMNMPEGDAVAQSFAHAGVLVLNLDYRRVAPDCDATQWNGAPAVRYPTPILDGQAGFNRLREEAIARGVPADRLFVGGASAGGNLAVHTVAWNARDGRPPAAGLVLAYPFVHGYPTDRPAVGGWFDRMAMDGVVKRATRCFMGSTDPDRLALVHPQPEALAGFPPAIIITGEDDPLRPSGDAFADDLRRAGVAVTIRLEPGTEHGHVNQPMTGPYDKTMATFIDWLLQRSQGPG
jgi:acetyl esterase